MRFLVDSFRYIIQYTLSILLRLVKGLTIIPWFPSVLGLTNILHNLQLLTLESKVIVD